MARRLLRFQVLSSFSQNNIRGLSTTSVCNSKKNFRCFPLYNKRGSMDFLKQQKENPDPDIPVYTYGERQPGMKIDGEFVVIPEMIPEIVVPDLTGFTLKPYVSYKASDVVQSEFTAKDLFDAIYKDKIINDFAEGKLDEEGNPVDPNDYEKMTPEEALQLAQKTGCDLN